MPKIVREKDKKIRRSFSLSPKAVENLSKMAKLLHTSQSELLDDMILNASENFFKLFNVAKDKGIYSSALKVVAGELEKLADEFDSMKGDKDE